MPRNKYQIVLRRNPTGKTETAENGQKIRAMGPYNKKSDAVKDAKALPVQTGIAVLVEPVPAAKNFRSASKLVGSLSRRMAKKPKRRKTTGPSRGIKGGYVSNPRGAMDVHRQAHQMAADIADATQKAMMKAPYRKLHLGFVPSQHDGKRITKAGTIYIQDEDAKTPAGYQYIMPIPGNLRWLATRYQLVNRLREITGKLPVLGERGGKPKIVVQVTGLKKNPRSRAGIISNPRKLWKRVGVIRIYRDSEWDEYIVKDSEGGTYHTDDKEDALATARRMNTARKNPRRHKGPSTHVHRRKRSHGGPGITSNPRRSKVKNNPRSRSGYMTKAQFTSFFRSEVWPSIKHLDPTTRRTTWNDMVDSFEKDGTIDPRADWTQPDWMGAHRRRHRR